MNLGELLNLLRGAILNDRSDRTGGANDYLWQDATLVTYINEAQRLMAVKGLVLRDGTTDEVTKITLVEGQTTYPLHESIVAVISAKREDQNVDLTRVGHSIFSGYRQSTDTWSDPATLQTLPAGMTRLYSTDEGLGDRDTDTFSQMQLRIYPAPSAAEAGKVIRLRVCRKPLEKLRVGVNAMIPEIPEDYHIEMLDHAAYLALRIVDDDAGAPRQALQFKAMFDANVMEARRQTMRKLFAPMEMGFGRGGWSWGR